MKKLMLIVAVTFFLGAMSFAQQDTRSGQDQDQGQTTPADQNQDQGQTTPPVQNNHTMDNGTLDNGTGLNADQTMKGWTKVDPVDIPAGLRTSLGSPQYSGWEKSTVYVNQAGDRYSIRLGEPAAPKTYFFDRSGKPIEGMTDDQQNLNK